MAPPRHYPPANITAQWFADTYPGTDMGGVDKVLLHTTETGGWPGYKGGASAPTLTYDPSKHQWRQHFPLHRSARALRDPAGTPVKENRDRVVQVEIVCSSDKAFAARYGYLHVASLGDLALRDLGAFVRFMHQHYAVPLVAAKTWLPYPQSYGNSAARMSSSQYDAFKGVLGHQHASGNDHGDPGAIDIAQIMTYARAGTEPPEDDMPGPADWTAADWAAFDAHVTKQAGVGVHNQQIGRKTDPNGNPITFGVATDRIYEATTSEPPAG